MASRSRFRRHTLLKTTWLRPKMGRVARPCARTPPRRAVARPGPDVVGTRSCAIRFPEVKVAGSNHCQGDNREVLSGLRPQPNQKEPRIEHRRNTDLRRNCLTG